MSFVVTYDHIEEQPMLLFQMNMPGRELDPSTSYKFRLLDDDDEIYFSGLSTSCDDDDAFLPLDWAKNRYGCTYIQYLQPNGIWETL